MFAPRKAKTHLWTFPSFSQETLSFNIHRTFLIISIFLWSLPICIAVYSQLLICLMLLFHAWSSFCILLQSSIHFNLLWFEHSEWNLEFLAFSPFCIISCFLSPSADAASSLLTARTANNSSCFIVRGGSRRRSVMVVQCERLFTCQTCECPVLVKIRGSHVRHDASSAVHLQIHLEAFLKSCCVHCYLNLCLIWVRFVNKRQLNLFLLI